MRDDVLTGKKIILGITGGIAAYKSAHLVRDFKKRGAEVKVVMTPSAAEFVTPLTFSVLSGNPVIVNSFPSGRADNTSLHTWHIELAVWADAAVIAPATVNTVAKIANGFADNALTTLVSALRCPLVIAPAADADMYENKMNAENLRKLAEAGFYIVYPEDGELASGLMGKGRLADNSKIIDAAELVLSGRGKDLNGRKMLVTAGPTYEDIDPVRFIGNRSSGRMGYEIAKAAFLRGADVTLISGPSRETAYPEISLLKVRSSFDMKNAVEKELKKNEILIMAAAVADYKPAIFVGKKIKKQDRLSAIALEETEDILAAADKEGKTVVGFALETDNELDNARKKMKNKNLDMIVMNSLKDNKSGFEVDTNKVTVIHRNGKQVKYPLMSKFQTANKIIDEILKIKTR